MEFSSRVMDAHIIPSYKFYTENTYCNHMRNLYETNLTNFDIVNTRCNNM